MNMLIISTTIIFAGFLTSFTLWVNNLDKETIMKMPLVKLWISLESFSKKNIVFGLIGIATITSIILFFY